MKHSCRTYFIMYLNTDGENGTFDVSDAHKLIEKTLGVRPEQERTWFTVGYNNKYDVNVNEMLRITLKDLIGKEDKIKALCTILNASAYLEIVPEIVCGSEEPTQILSLERDVIEFLYKSGTEVDMDYYVYGGDKEEHTHDEALTAKEPQTSEEPQAIEERLANERKEEAMEEFRKSVLEVAEAFFAMPEDERKAMVEMANEKCAEAEKEYRKKTIKRIK